MFHCVLVGLSNDQLERMEIISMTVQGTWFKRGYFRQKNNWKNLGSVYENRDKC